MIERNSDAIETGRAAVAETAGELDDPLTAACNYIGIARILLGSSDSGQSQTAAESLNKAEAQILRAVDIARALQDSPGSGV